MLITLVNFILLFTAIVYFYRKNGFSIKVYALVFILLYYTIIPILLYFSRIGILKLNKTKFIDINPLQDFIIIQVVILIGIIGFLIGIFWNNIPFKLKLENENKTKYKLLKYSVFFITILAIISLYKYIMGFGGIKQAIYYAPFVRQGIFKEIWNQSTSHLFYKRFIFLSLIPLIWRPVLNFNRTTIFLITLVNGFVLMFLYIFLNGGRQVIIDLIIIFILAKYSFNRVSVTKTASLVLLAIVALPVFESVFSGELSLSVSLSDIISNVYAEFSHPYLNLVLYQSHELFVFQRFYS